MSDIDDNEPLPPGRKRKQKKARKKMLNGKLVYHTTGIPKPQRTIEEKIELGKKILDRYSTGLYTLYACCNYFHVSYLAFNKWTMITFDPAQALLEGIPFPPNFILELHEYYKKTNSVAETNYGQRVRDLARKSLLNKLDKQVIVEVNEEYTIDKRMVLEDGSPNPDFGKPILVTKKVKTKELPASDALVQFALVNKDSENFREKKQISVSGSVSRNNLDEYTDEQLDSKISELEATVGRKRLNAAETIPYEDVAEDDDDELDDDF